jgi:hypothetical protein
VAEAGGEGFDELSMVVGLLAWLAWDVEVDIEAASKRNGLQGVEDESWYSIQVFGTLAAWLSEDESAIQVLEESVSRTPRVRVDGDRWLRVHRELAEAYARAAADPDSHGQLGRRPRPGDLVVLSDRESPRVRIVLDVRPGADGGKVVFFDPAGTDGERAFLASRIRSLPWTREVAGTAVSAS